MTRKILIAFFIIASCCGYAYTAASPLKNIIASAEVIVLGEVFGIHSFWDANKKNIYTSYKIKTDTVIKGSAGSEIQILVQGGIVDNVWQKVSSAASLNIYDRGYFMLNRLEASDKIPVDSSSPFYLIKGGENGFIATESDVPVRKNKIRSKLLPEFLLNLKELMNYNPPLTDNKTVHLKSAVANAVITKLSPLELTAGTGEVLTIHGNGFGQEQNDSEIWFSYADQEHTIFTHPEMEIISWSDTAIRIVVPTEAATGKLLIKTAGQDVLSQDVLKIRYAYTNLDFMPIFLVNSDGTGGYTWQLHSDIGSNPLAAKIIENAVGKWVCATSIPWKVGSQTTGTAAIDGKCLIALDSLDGTLGFTSAVYDKVFISEKNFEWVLAEVDIILNSNQNWSFSRESLQNDQLDFETVILHELGHAMLIGHVNNKDDLMHSNITPGIIKNIGHDNIACTDFIIKKSLEFKNRDYLHVQPVEQLALGLPGAVTGPENLCANATESNYFIPKINNASGYIWEIFPNDAAVLTPTDSLVKVLWTKNFSGEASLTVRPENYCGSLGSKSTLVITINNVTEVIQPVVVANNDTVSSNQSFAAYQWYNENGIIPGANSREYFAGQSGIYYLQVTDSQGCTSISEGITVLKTSTRLPEAQKFHFVIYPNPSEGKFYIKIENNFSRNILVKIYNQMGQNLFSREVNESEHLQELEFSGYAKGIYLVQVSNSKSVASQKIILK